MISWQDSGLILHLRKHGDHHAITTMFTQQRGLHAGMVNYAYSKKNRGLVLAGNMVQAEWNARLANQLGRWQLEMQRAYAASCMHHPLNLTMLQCVCAMLHDTLPEHHPYPDLYDATMQLLDQLSSPITPLQARHAYGLWEYALLTALGYRLDLSHCAATGSEDGLRYISPRTGRAVSEAAGAAYKHKLLPFPDLLAKNQAKLPVSEASVIDLLQVTGYFLERWAFVSLGKTLPAMRAQLLPQPMHA